MDSHPRFFVQNDPFLSDDEMMQKKNHNASKKRQKKPTSLTA
jgi:hypothetical protein